MALLFLSCFLVPIFFFLLFSFFYFPYIFNFLIFLRPTLSSLYLGLKNYLKVYISFKKYCYCILQALKCSCTFRSHYPVRLELLAANFYSGPRVRQAAASAWFKVSSYYFLPLDMFFGFEPNFLFIFIILCFKDRGCFRASTHDVIL